MEDDLRGTVIIYTNSKSRECRTARSELTSMNIPYTDICLDIFPQCREEMERLAGTSEVPQIFFNEIHIGGLEGLHQLANDEKKLDALMEMLRTTESPIGAPSLPLPEISGEIREEPDENGNDEKENASSQDLEEIPENTQEYVALISNMKKANIIRDNLVGTKKLCKNSFKGEDFIKWIMKERKLKRSEAIDLGQRLVSQESRLRRLKSTDIFDPDRFYEISETEDLKALNQGPTTSDSISPETMNEMLIQILTPLYKEILSCNNRVVDYACLQESEHFQRYLSYCNELQRVAVTEDTGRNVKIALFLNIYNIMQIHMYYKYGPPTNIWQRRKLLWSTYYLIDKKLFSLHSILNGILRGNRKSDNMLWKPFGKNDRRRKLAVKDPDPSVLFAVSSATKSSCPIHLYTSQNVNEELKEVVQAALASDEMLVIDNKKPTIAVSPIFDWYAVDFGLTQENLIKWILDNMKEGPKKENLKRVFDTKAYTIDYLDYDWTLNSREQKLLTMF